MGQNVEQSVGQRVSHRVSSRVSRKGGLPASSASTDHALVQGLRAASVASHTLANPVVRQRTIARMRQSSAPLIVIHAPAGFGKSTVIQQYCECLQSPSKLKAQPQAQSAVKPEPKSQLEPHTQPGTKRVAWIHFEAPLVDLGPLLEMLFEQLQVQPGRHGYSLRSLLRALEELPQGAVLVFDDFDRALSDPKQTELIQTFFTRLLRALPPQVQLIIASRARPSLELPRLRLRQKVEILNEDDLRFTLAESQFFLRSVEGLAVEEIAALHERTDGWPAALQCCLLQLQAGLIGGDTTAALQGSTHAIMEFLAAEVFDPLPRPLQIQLLELSAPERLCGELVETLLSSDSGSPLDAGQGFTILDQLESAGLFLNRLKVEGGWYKFHSVFRDFLLNNLALRFPQAKLQRQHHLVANWFIDHGLDDQALVHLIEAGETQKVVAVLAQCAEKLIAEERLGLVLYCMSRISEAVLVQDPGMFYAGVVTYSFTRDFEKAHALVEQRRKILEQTCADPVQVGLLHSAELFIYAAQDRVAEMGETSFLVEEHLDSSHGFQFAVALNARAYWLVAQSKFEDARALLLRARSLHDQSRSLFGQAYQEGISSTILSATGRIDDSLKALTKASRDLEKATQGAGFGGTVIDAYLADALYEKGHFDDAAYVLEHANAALEEHAIVDPLATKFIVQARLALIDDDVRGAEETLERAISLGHRHNLNTLVECAYLELARMFTLLGKGEEAKGYLAQRDENFLQSQYLLHCNETEGHTITRARWLMYQGELAQAKRLLTPAIKRATPLNRVRRTVKLKILYAIALREEGDAVVAKRVMGEALELGERGGMQQSFLDEGAKCIRLLKELRRGMPRLPDPTREDSLLSYIDQLLVAAGEHNWEGSGNDAQTPIDLIDKLTDREAVILQLVGEGLGNQDMAARLSISINTVKWHLRKVYEKLGVNSRIQAVTVARHMGLID